MTISFIGEIVSMWEWAEDPGKWARELKMKGG
jgi:hypothetical protein